MIILEKPKTIKKHLVSIVDITSLAKLIHILNLVNFTQKYIWVMNNIYIYITKKLKLTSVQNFWKYID